MMENLVVFLFLAVGLAAGVLLTLIIDGRILGQQLAEAVTENRRLQQKIRSLSSRLAAAQTQVEQFSRDLAELSHQIGALTELSQAQREEIAAATAVKETISEQYHQLTDRLESLRSEHEQACRRVAVADVELAHLRQDLAAAQDQTQQLVRLQADKQLLQSKIDDMRARFESAQHQLNAAGLKGKSQIEIVRGIGPTYARRLHEAGIHNLAELAGQTAERVGEIVGLKTWQRADPQAWIDEAKELAAAFSDDDSA